MYSICYISHKGDIGVHSSLYVYIPVKINYIVHNK